MIGFSSGHWEGLDGLGDEALKELRKSAERTLMQGLVRFVKELKITLTGARHGRAYKVSRTGRLHIASAPREAPAVLSGNLRNSIGFSPPVWDGGTVSGEVGTGLGGARDPSETYARRLEFGGIDRRGVKLEARPYMAPTALRMEPILDKLFEDFV